MNEAVFGFCVRNADLCIPLSPSRRGVLWIRHDASGAASGKCN